MPSAETTTQNNNSQSSIGSSDFTGGSRSSSTNRTTTSGLTDTSNAFNNVVNPYAPAAGNLQDILARAASISWNPSNFVPVQGATTQQGIQSLINTANQGSAAIDPLTGVVNGSVGAFGTGANTLQSTAAGNNLSQVSPALRAVLDRVGQDTANRVNQQFSGAGRYGSANHAGAIAREVANAENNALVGNYNQERGYQNQAANTIYGGGFTGAGMASGIDQARLLTPQLLGQAGALQDTQANAARTADQNALQFLSSMTNPIAGLGQSSSGASTGQTSMSQSQVQSLINRIKNWGSTSSNSQNTGTGTSTQGQSNPVGTAIGIGTSLLGLL